MYHKIDILLATKHQKEKAIQPAFKAAFDANIVVPDGYDTDLFGTFTGEIPRKGTPQEVLIQKALQASERYQSDYVLSSEGSFAPHPTLFFCPADIEMICFYDKKRNIKVIESDISTQTNFDHHDIQEKNDYFSFLEKILFPSHAVILRDVKTNRVIEKGITDIEKLSALINAHFSCDQKLRIETDMRALYNPTRMQVIQNLTHKLIARLKNQCEKCDAPGFGAVSFHGHLPCEYCGLDTDLHAQKVESCLVCDHQKISPRADGLLFSKQQYCNYCNP